MRLFRMGWIWGVVYVITVVPLSLFFLLTLVEASYRDSWSPLASPYNLQAFAVLLFPFFLALFVAAVVLHRRDRRLSPPRRSALGVPLPAWVIVWGMTLTILVASRYADAPSSEEQKRELAATGCVNDLRDASSPLPASYFVLVYDRRCPSAPKHTVNVSIQDSSTPTGPGNAFAVEAADGSDASAQELTVFAFVPPSRREVEIRYGGHGRVLTHNALVRGLAISAQEDSLLERH
jgi:hypothetical protein